MNRYLFRTTCGALSLLLTSASAVRADDTKNACTNAYTQSQTLRDAHRLRESRDQLRICSQPACPAFIVKDCTTWLVESDARLPSIVLSAKDSRGNQLVDVTVSVDGVPFAEKLGGESIDIDPGQHTFTFVTSDGTKIDEALTVLEGQKAQPVVAIIPVAPSSTRPAIAAAAAPFAGAGERDHSAEMTSLGSFWTLQRKIGAVGIGIGISGIVAGSIFGALAKSAVSQQNGDCSPSSCPRHADALTEHSTAVTDSTTSTAAFVIGGVLLASGVVLLVTGGRRTSATATLSPQLRVEPGVVPAGGGMVLKGEF